MAAADLIKQGATKTELQEEKSACREKLVLAAEYFPINRMAANLTGSPLECVSPAQGKNNTATLASY